MAETAERTEGVFNPKVGQKLGCNEKLWFEN
jgi:hypothetical protein